MSILGRTSPRMWAWIAGGVAVLALAAAFPGIESLPAPHGAPIAAPPEERLVRVSADGRRVVYDKDRGWISAKCAELFPRTATRVFPADYVETPDGLVETSVTARPPVWR